MRLLFPILLATLLLMGLPATGLAFVVIHRVNRETQAKLGLEFTLTAELKEGAMYVKIEAPRKGRLATLSMVQIDVKDADGKEVLAAPVATTDVKGVMHAQFRLAPQLAARCTIILETEASMSNERDFAVNYLIALKGYLEPPAFSDPPGVVPLEGKPEKPKAAATPLQDGWAKLKGQVVWDGQVPAQPKIVPGVNQNVCAQDKRPLEEDFIIDQKTNGLKNVFVWIRPAGAKGDDAFPAKLINPALVKPDSPTVSINQPCCRFIPHVLAAREGQQLIINNNAPIAHNSKWSSSKNGDYNPLIPAGDKFTLPQPLVFERGEITLQCSLHSWMKAHVRVFDHPYFAVTDAEGNFEINNAPAGKFSLYIHHPANGWLNGAVGRNGTPIVIKAGEQNLGVFKMKKNQ